MTLSDGSTMCGVSGRRVNNTFAEKRIAYETKKTHRLHVASNSKVIGIFNIRVKSVAQL